MTKPPRKFRNRAVRFLGRNGLILAVLVLAALLRLDGIGFGLPSLNDPDEPLFMMLSFDMLARGSADPQWFGHPGTTTLYSIALVMVAVAGAGLASGAYADLSSFAAAVYTDPGLVILPARLMIAATGVACVLLTYRIGFRLWGRGAGLVAALVLAINAVHITWSQVVRTDLQASLFMLLSVLAAMRVLRRGLFRDYVLAGAFVGLACATKWPGSLMLLSAMVAASPALAKGGWRRAALIPLSALAALIIVSPFLVLSFDKVLADLTAEARGTHPGATGGGLVENLWWYASGPLTRSLGIFGLTVSCAGIVGAAFASRLFRLAVLPGFALFLLAIGAQSLVWERWLIPVLPLFALGIGWAAKWCAGMLQPHAARLALPLLGAGVLLPMGLASYAASAERHNDTRQMATRWIAEHAPPGSTILVEHAAVDLIQQPFTVLFPLGEAGCIDGGAVLRGQISPSELEATRHGSAVVDLGHLPADKLATCRADFAVLTHYDRYRDDRARFPQEWARYRELTGMGVEQIVFLPSAGKAGGPPVRIYAFGKAATARAIDPN